jgi:diaminopimelate epimerase
MKFAKYHALGNDYLVIDPKDLPAPLTAAQIKTICHRNFGVGSDGILLGPLPSKQARFGLRIFNPDGSEAEKSVKSTVFEKGKMVRVEMGKVSFWSDTIPVTGPRREVINEKISVGGKSFTFCAASIGNPHCVLPLPEINAGLAREFGPLIEVHPDFPKRTNVQFLKVLDRGNIQIEIWERGAGYTLASGSSSSAAAAVAHKLGLCDRSITVHMPGGKLAIEIGADFDILMTGPVTKVAEGVIANEIQSE